MCYVRAASEHESDMSGGTSLPLLGALPLAALALAGCGGSASQALPTTSEQVTPPARPQGGGGYGGGGY